MIYSEEINNQLNTIIEKNIAAVKGYRETAENTNNTTFKNMFLEQASKRETFVSELQAEVTKYGGSPKRDTDFTSDLHRTWIDVKQFFSSNNEEALFEEIIRGEENAVKEYEEVLRETQLTDTSERMLRNQLAFIKSSVSKMRSLETQVA
ncbi:PA2169 family four-helix-bundle protein [Aquimarina sp. ERC-38]|uniref:ferritin-like domain-containing protein n=1 Tax=Aquimarina sp. ERC-38 TaxID=2949996 RepID=UPI00224634C3|nr:PA2169 family four-helix-bundle protein [Aquimarina sp. ERC-38]UZO81518.1 PA2169 family four-helix-bundle protein [Aquimarina sp. ERC-38]